MNGTESNFTVPDRDPTLAPFIDSFNVQGEEVDTAHHAYFPNITGFIHGSSQFYNLSAPLNESLSWTPLAQTYVAGFNLTEASSMWGEWGWNTSSKAALSLVEKKPAVLDEKMPPSGLESKNSNIALVHGRIELTDAKTSEDLRFEFEGVHFLSNGSIYGFAEPPGRRIDIRLLPSIVPEASRNETAAIIAPELSARITKLRNLIDAGILDQGSTSDDSVKTSCPFQFFAHIHPAPVPDFLMKELEEELQNPTGISTITPPKLSITGVLVSKECGILYTLHDTEGLRSRTFFRKVTTYAGLCALSYLTILLLFSHQLELSRTPSGISRISRWTFLTQATMDSVSFAGHITFAILAEGRPSLSLIAPAFLACILFVQEAQLFTLVNQIQGSENVRPSPTPAAAPPSPPAPQQQPRVQSPTPALGSTMHSSPNPTPVQAAPPSGPPRRLPPPPRRGGRAPAPIPPPPTPQNLDFPPTPTAGIFPNTGGRTLNGRDPVSLGTSRFPNLVQLIPNAATASPTAATASGTTGTAANTAGTATTQPDPSPAMGFLSFFWHFVRTDPQAQLWIGLFVFLAIIVQVILSPMLSVIFVATTYSMVWLPQIIRSARRNRASGLSRGYVVGVTVCRLGIAMYFLNCPKNVLEVEPREWAPLLAFLVVAQALVLMLQDTIGPSFFLPERFKATQGYDYHPPMPLPDSESPDQSLGDCAICMDEILLDPSLRPPASRKSESAPTASGATDEKGGPSISMKKRRGGGILTGGGGESSDGRQSGYGGGGGLHKKIGSGLANAMKGVGSSKARKNYSLAPCCHLFHTECLEKWLAIKNICPQCRRPLPPL